MALFNIKNNTLLPVAVKKFDLERDIQRLTEQNLQPVFGLQFISGSLNKEFSVRVEEQDFYIDSLALDESDNSLVIIEYKKERSFSVIDQGFAYLSAMLNNKAEFVLEANKRLGKNFSKEDISWETSRVVFIATEFTNYQRNAINFRDLPIYLYEVTLYDNGSIDYNPIKALRTSESIKKLTSDATIQKVTREVKVYTQDDLLKPEWEESAVLLSTFENQLKKTMPETKIKYNKHYIAYISKHGRNYVEIVPQRQGLKVYYRFPADTIASSLTINDCSTIGHWPNGITYISLTNMEQIPEAVKLAKESFLYLHKDIYT